MLEAATRCPDALTAVFVGEYYITNRWTPTTDKAGNRTLSSLPPLTIFHVMEATKDGRLSVDVPLYPKQDLYVRPEHIDHRAMEATSINLLPILTVGMKERSKHRAQIHKAYELASVLLNVLGGLQSN